MVFKAPSWLPRLPHIPDVSLCEFMFDEQYGRAPFNTSLDAYVCSESGTRITAIQQKQNVDFLARGLASDLGWTVNSGSEYDKVVSVFALNTIDIPTVTWAVHRLNGICSPINAAYTAGEVAELLKRSGAKALFTVLSLLPIAEEAAQLVGIPLCHVYLLEMKDDNKIPESRTTFRSLLQRGESLRPLESLQWKSGDSARKTAFLSHSSGTTGPPKMAAVSHHNIIANIIQFTLFDVDGRGGPDARQIVLGMLPASHVYGVVMISHLATYRGDSVIVLPRFDMHVVPAIIVALGKSPELLQKYDLSSITHVLCGGAPIDENIMMRLKHHFPQWAMKTGYGLTEIGAGISMTSVHEPWPGSSGVIIPGVTVKLLLEDGTEVTEYGSLGEVYALSPGVILGYKDDPEATNETFVQHNGERWLRTGDIAFFKKSPSGDEHIFIVDRVKEVIKVKAIQVVPAELESYLLTHPAVSDCAVVGIPDERAGEVPIAYVQRSTQDMSNESLAQELIEFVKKQKARHKWLAGGVVFVDVIPRSPSGKILRRVIRAQRREGAAWAASKI